MCESRYIPSHAFLAWANQSNLTNQLILGRVNESIYCGKTVRVKIDKFILVANKKTKISWSQQEFF